MYQQVPESVGDITLELRRTGDPTNAVSVQYSAIEDGAGAELDFTPSSGVVTFGPNQTNQFLRLRIIDDDLPEETERFAVSLHTPSEGVVLEPRNYATVYINASDLAFDTEGVPHAIVYYVDALGITYPETVALADDGRTLAVGYERELALVDLIQQTRVASIPVAAQHLLFSPDCSRLLAHDGSNLLVLDSKTLQTTQTLHGTGWPAAFSSDGQRLLSSGLSSVSVWDLRTGGPSMTLTWEALAPCDDVPISVGFLPATDEILAATGSANRRFHNRSGALLTTFRIFAPCPSSSGGEWEGTFALSLEGDRLLVGVPRSGSTSFGHRATALFDTATGERIRVFGGTSGLDPFWTSGPVTMLGRTGLFAFPSETALQTSPDFWCGVEGIGVYSGDSSNPVRMLLLRDDGGAVLNTGMLKSSPSGRFLLQTSLYHEWVVWDLRDLTAHRRIESAGANRQLRWDTGILQSAEQVNGSWVDKSEAVSPLALDTATASMFYRVRIEP
jgi:hypothetical protein